MNARRSIPRNLSLTVFVYPALYLARLRVGYDSNFGNARLVSQSPPSSERRDRGPEYHTSIDRERQRKPRINNAVQCDGMGIEIDACPISSSPILIDAAVPALRELTVPWCNQSLKAATVSYRVRVMIIAAAIF